MDACDVIRKGVMVLGMSGCTLCRGDGVGDLGCKLRISVHHNTPEQVPNWLRTRLSPQGIHNSELFWGRDQG